MKRHLQSSDMRLLSFPSPPPPPPAPDRLAVPQWRLLRYIDGSFSQAHEKDVVVDLTVANDEVLGVHHRFTF